MLIHGITIRCYGESKYIHTFSFGISEKPIEIDLFGITENV